MKRINTLIAGCALLVSTAAPAAFAADPSFDVGSHGYFRTGGGVSADGANGDERGCFQAPGAAAKYRLGNECETYAEGSLYADIRPDKDAGPFFHVEGMANFLGDDFEAVEYLDMNQLFVETGGYQGLGDTKFWVGRRFYERHDSHMNDFFWLNMSNGDGGGVRDIDVGIGKLSYAFLRDSTLVDMNSDGDTADAVDRKVYQNNHDVRLGGMKVNKNGTLELWYNYAHSADTDSGAFKYGDQSGHSFGVIHSQQEFFGGFNKASFQYGTGLGRTLTANGLSALRSNSGNLDDARIYRAVDNSLLEVNKDISVMTTLVWEKTESGNFDGTEQTWLSAGVRPYYYFTDNIRGVVELGYDHVSDDSAGGDDGSLYKYTLAAELAPSRGAFVRPVLRAYVTGATWSDEWKGAVGGPSHANDTSGLNLGLQAEYWW